MALEILALINIANGTVVTCSDWRTIFNLVLHLVLNITVIVYFIARLVRRSKRGIYFIVKWILVYLIFAVLADLHFHVSMYDLDAYITLQVFGLVLLLSLPFLLIPFPCVASVYCGIRRVWVQIFCHNFTQRRKWFRLLMVAMYIMAISGAILALIAIPLPWFSVRFQGDKVMSDILALINKFTGQLSLVIDELQDVADYGATFTTFSTCGQFVSAVGAAIGLSLTSGTSASVLQTTVLRTASSTPG